VDRLLNVLIRLKDLDRRVLFIFVALAVAIPVLKPMGLPIRSSRESVDFHRELTSLKAGDTILFSFDYDPQTRAELDPMTRVIWTTCFEKGVKIIALTLYPGGVGVADEISKELAEIHGKTYGEDYLFLGYNPDWSGTMLRLGESFRKTYPTDQLGRETGSFPIMENVDSYADTPLLVSVSSSAMAEYWAIWAGGKFGQKVITGNTAIQAVLVYPYYYSGQISGFLGGLKGAAELEMLTGQIGAATRGMDSQTTGHVLMVVFILLGNVAFLAERLRKRRAA